MLGVPKIMCLVRSGSLWRRINVRTLLATLGATVNCIGANWHQLALAQWTPSIKHALYFTEATKAIASMPLCYCFWCPRNAPVEIKNVIIGWPLPRRKCLGAFVQFKKNEAYRSDGGSVQVAILFEMLRLRYISNQQIPPPKKKKNSILGCTSKFTLSSTPCQSYTHNLANDPVEFYKQENDHIIIEAYIN